MPPDARGASRHDIPFSTRSAGQPSRGRKDWSAAKCDRAGVRRPQCAQSGSGRNRFRRNCVKCTRVVCIRAERASHSYGSRRARVGLGEHHLRCVVLVTYVRVPGIRKCAKANHRTTTRTVRSSLERALALRRVRTRPTRRRVGRRRLVGRSLAGPFSSGLTFFRSIRIEALQTRAHLVSNAPPEVPRTNVGGIASPLRPSRVAARLENSLAGPR